MLSSKLPLPPSLLASPTMRSRELCQALLTCLIHYATAQTSASPVKFLYPTGSPTFNINDTVQVHYTTPWATVDLTVYCFETMGSNVPENYPTYENPCEYLKFLTVKDLCPNMFYQLTQCCSVSGSGLYNIEHIGNTDDLTGKTSQAIYQTLVGRELSPY